MKLGNFNVGRKVHYTWSRRTPRQLTVEHALNSTLAHCLVEITFHKLRLHAERFANCFPNRFLSTVVFRSVRIGFRVSFVFRVPCTATNYLVSVQK